MLSLGSCAWAVCGMTKMTCCPIWKKLDENIPELVKLDEGILIPPAVRANEVIHDQIRNLSTKDFYAHCRFKLSLQGDSSYNNDPSFIN